MVDIEYVKSFNEIYRSNTEKHLLSLIRKKDAILSMSRVGDLKKLPKKDSLPVYDGTQKVGLVHIPREFYQLAEISYRVNVWVSNITEDGRSSAFRVSASGDWDVTEVRFNWGLTQGIRDLVLEGVSLTYKCKVDDVSMNKLIEILSDYNKLRSFLLDPSTGLSSDYQNRIRKNGV